MLRTARTIASILRSLLLGSVAFAAVGAVSVGTIGCNDESAPETWVKRLNDPVYRPAAVKRLMQFFEDAMTRANKNREDPVVKELLDKIVEPMTKTYLEGNLDEKTRIELIKFLADSRDVRAKAAWIKACDDFAAGKSTVAEDDVRWVAPALGALKLEDGAQALGAAFVKLQAGTLKGSQAYKNVHDAMLQIESPSWKSMLLERINRPVERPAGRNDSAKVTAYQNELFWQTTAAEILGDLKDPNAVRPLMKIVMDPQKADIAPTASVAIIKIGKAAAPVLIDALMGKDADIVEFAKGKAGGNVEESKAYVRSAAVVLGALGRAEATAPLIEVLGVADSDINRAVIARELTKLPATPESEKAFQTAYDKMNPSTLIPPGMNARQQLLEASSHFYDPQLVPWLLKQITGAKGGENEKAVIQTAAEVSAIKLMTKAQMGEVSAVVEKIGATEEKESLRSARDVLKACGDNVGCYVSKIQEPAVQEQKMQFAGMKAGYMLAILGNPGTSMEIAKALPKVKNAAVRFVAVQAIDHLTQKDTAAVADALQKVVDDNKKRDDRNMMQADAPVKEVIYRLRAR
jgi:hypothetical protein